MFIKGNKVRCKEAVTLIDHVTFNVIEAVAAGTNGEIVDEIERTTTEGKTLRAFTVKFDGLEQAIIYIDKDPLHSASLANLELVN